MIETALDVQLDVDYIATLPACYRLGLAVFTERGPFNISQFFKDTADCREGKKSNQSS